MIQKLILIGCVKTKGDAPCEARDLYTSPLFKKRRAYAEAQEIASGTPWAIITAHETGIFFPGQIVAPYDRTMSDHTHEERRHWMDNISIRSYFLLADAITNDAKMASIEVHAGQQYFDAFCRAMANCRPPGMSLQIRHPVRGMQIGEQLRFYGGHNGP